jgi:hypothetical protein
MLAIATLTTACLPAMDLSTDDMRSSGGPTLDDSSILARIAGGAYRTSTRFRPMSGAPYSSAVAAQTNVDVFVSADDYASYARISPDKSGSGASLAPGAIVVREVLDASGAVAKLTLMAKGPPGYNPAVGDFWFGVTQPDGTPVVDNGATQMGKLGECFGCHIPRAGDGYLFGVAAAHRGNPGSTPPATGGDGGVVAPADMDASDACGDFICSASESCDSCPTDCHCCGNGNRHGHTGGCDGNDQ